MRLYPLDNKIVLRVKNNAAEFLKGYTTNTLDAPRNAFVNIRGQIVCTFDQMAIRPQALARGTSAGAVECPVLSSPEKVLVVIEKQYVDRLSAHLKPYLQLAGTVIEPAPEFHLYFDLDDQHEPQRGEIFVIQKKGKLIGTTAELTSNVSEPEFTLFRLKNQLPVQGIDFDEELLLNVANEEFVSYTKGCYLGQEIIARVHHRSKPPKKLVVKSLDQCGKEEASRMTSKSVDPETGKTLGFVFIANE